MLTLPQTRETNDNGTKHENNYHKRCKAHLLYKYIKGEKIMSNKLPRKALIAVSSFNGAIYPDGHKTGVFFFERLSVARRSSTPEWLSQFQ